MDIALDTIYHMKAEELVRALPADYIDLIVTSPPYDDLRIYKGFTWDFELIAQQSYRVLKLGGVMVWVVGDAMKEGCETLTSFRQALYFKEQVGFRVQTVIWQKPSGAPGTFKNRLDRVFEYMFVCSKGEIATFNPPKIKTKTFGRRKRRKKQGDKHGWRNLPAYQDKPTQRYKIADNIWLCDHGYGRTSTDGTNTHPAMFPEALVARHIETWSNPGDIVLDFFLGSGTTAKMARNLGRHYIGCDISQEYVELAQRRLQNTDPFQTTVNQEGIEQPSLFGEPDL